MTLYPAATWRPVQNFTNERMSEHLGLVLHVAVGDGSPYGWMLNPASQVSSTFWVGKLGEVEQYVDADLIAWAQAAGNGTYNSVETEGFPNEVLTDAQVDALAALYRWGHDTYGWPFVDADVVGQAGFAWHGMGGVPWGNHPDCPGDIRKGQRVLILQKASGGTIEPIPPVTPTPTPEPNPKPEPAPVAPPYSGRLIMLANPMMNGTDVRIWQQQMQNRGWTITVDAVYGPKSEGVCKEFQQQKGLTVDGIVGPITWGESWTAPITVP